VNRTVDGEAALRAEGRWFCPHPWLNVFLTDDTVGPVVAETLVTTGETELGTTPIRADRPARTPLFSVTPGELV
jgi:cytokinin dehydrogenase